MAFFLTRCVLCIGCISAAAAAGSGADFGHIAATVDRGASESAGRACLASASCRAMGAAAVEALISRMPGDRAGSPAGRTPEVGAGGAPARPRR